MLDNMSEKEWITFQEWRTENQETFTAILAALSKGFKEPVNAREIKKTLELNVSVEDVYKILQYYKSQGYITVHTSEEVGAQVESNEPEIAEFYQIIDRLKDLPDVRKP